MRRFILLLLVTLVTLTACSISEQSDEIANNAQNQKPSAEATFVETQERATYNVLQLQTGFYLPTGTRFNRNLGYIGFGEANPVFSNHCHLGIDYKHEVGTPVHAIADGKVIIANDNATGYRPGAVFVIKHQTSARETFYATYGHIQNSELQEGDLVFASQKIGEIAPYSGIPHLHFAIRTSDPEQDAFPVRGYTAPTRENPCVNRWGTYEDVSHGFVDPEPFLLDNRYPLGYEFHGAGSLIEPDTTCFGCDRDEAVMHASSNKPMVAFQWVYDSNRCDHILIDVKDTTAINPFTRRTFQDTPLNVGVVARHWAHGITNVRDEYYTATLPVSIGHPRQPFNLVGVMLPEQLPYGEIRFVARCRRRGATLYDEKDIIARRGTGITLVDGRKWNGNGSVISDDARESYSIYGTTRDVALLTDNGWSGDLVAFQWQRSSQCPSLRIGDDDGNNVRVTLSVRGWDQSPRTERTRTVTLPYRITSSSFSNLYPFGNYNIITVKSRSENVESIDAVNAICVR